MTNSPDCSSPTRFRSRSASTHQAALFAALFQALQHCRPEVRGPILKRLETSLTWVPDHLEMKISKLLDPDALSVKDRIYGLWLLYLSVIYYPQRSPGMQIWIGPDLFSDDQRVCLRLRCGPDADFPGSKMLEGELTILAQAVNKRAAAEHRLTGPDQISIIVREHYP